MKKIYYSLLAGLLTLGFASCSDNNPDSPDSPDSPDTPSDGSVEVTISTAEIQTKANAMQEFGSNDKMNIFAKTYNQITAPNIIDNVVATYDGNAWTMSPKVYINSEQKNAFVYAVAPYSEDNTDPQKIAIDMNKQVDYMYSGAFVPASLTSPSIKLKMNHALSILTFNVIPVNYSGNGELKSIKIEGQNVYVTGTMDVSTGKVANGTAGSITADINKRVEEGGWKNSLPGVWAIPFNTKAGEVKVTFNVDGKNYELVLPEVEMKYGYQYVFRLALTNSGLEFDPSKTESWSLNQTTDEAPAFEGYGKLELKASGSWMYAPHFTGDAVFGTISAPSGNCSFEPGKKIESLTSGNAVIIESWNTTGFTLETLDGIDVVDVSDYE